MMNNPIRSGDPQRFALLAVLGLLLPSSVVAQTPLQPPDKTRTSAGREGVITGRVIGEDGQPIAKAMIEFYSVAAKSASFHPVPTDADGNFRLTGLSPAPYVLKVFVPGYVVDRRSRSVEFHRIGEHVALNLIKGSVITGRVTDAQGEPMVGTHVTPRLIRDLDGNPVPTRSQNYLPSRKTDDRGIYRLYGLEPGIYIVFINRNVEYLGPGHSREVSIYHPSATREGAAEIAVQSGQEVTGIDIRHRIDQGHTIGGKVVGEEEGFDRAYVVVNNLADGQTETGAGTGKSGGFGLRGLANGDYEIMAGHNADGRSIAASMPRKVTISGADVSGIVLKVERFGSISGRVVGEASGPPEKCDQSAQMSFEEILLKARPVQGTSSNSIFMKFQSTVGWNRGSVDRQGEFKLDNLFAGNYQLLADLPGESWFLRSITRSASAQNVAKPIEVSTSGIVVGSGESVTGVELKVAGGAATLRGKVVPASETDKLPRRIRVHLIPSEASAANNLLRYAETSVDNDGTFELKHIAPGKYWLLPKPEIEKEPDHPVAWDTVERAKLRQEAEAAKKEIELQSCQRVKDHVLHFNH